MQSAIIRVINSKNLATIIITKETSVIKNPITQGEINVKSIIAIKTKEVPSIETKTIRIIFNQT